MTLPIGHLWIRDRSRSILSSPLSSHSVVWTADYPSCGQLYNPMSSLALVLYRAGFAGTLACHSHCLFLAELPNVPVGKACLGHDTLDYLIPYLLVLLGSRSLVCQSFQGWILFPNPRQTPVYLCAFFVWLHRNITLEEEGKNKKYD